MTTRKKVVSTKETVKPTKRSIPAWLVLLIAMLILLLILLLVLEKSNPELPVLPATEKFAPQVSVDSAYLADLQRDLQIMRNCCEGKITTPEKKVVVVSKPTAKKKAVTVSSSASTELISKSSFKPTTDSQLKTAASYQTSLDGATYVGLTDGDFYITISPDNYIQYVFSKKLYDEAGGTNVPELNYKGSGKMFELNEDVFIYVERSTPVTASALNKDWSWTVYVGDKEGYSAYIPHELIKAEIMQVKGTLAGTISKEDIAKIGEFVPEVQTGRIKPNKITATGDFDNLAYEGWLFCTKMTYKQE